MVASLKFKRWWWLVVGVLGVVSSACGVGQAPGLASSQPPISSPTLSVSSQSSTTYTTFNSTNAPFAIQYPTDWSKSNQGTDDHEITFVSPDLNIFANVIFGDGVALTAEEGIDQMMSQLFVDPKVISKQRNADASYTAELEYTKDNTGARVHSFIRVMIAGTMYYVVQFNAPADKFETNRNEGMTIVNSFKLTR